MQADLLNDIRDVLDDKRFSFPRNSIGERACALAVERSRTVADARTFDEEIRSVQRLLSHAYYEGAFFRDTTLDNWFSLRHASWSELVEQGESLSAFASEIIVEDDDEEYARQEQEEKWDQAENDGVYGRTNRWDPEMDRWIFVRFGRMPREGYSHFGLAGEDNEDGPDPWRVELGGKRREDGTCVLRAIRHEDIPGALIVIEPDFGQALYGIESFNSYLHAIIPEDGPVLQVNGSLVRHVARDGCPRCDLGSDGEYLIDPRQPGLVQELDPDLVYVSKDQSLTQWRAERASRSIRF